MTDSIANRIANNIIQNPHIYGVPNITSAKVATGGVVHSVWELETEKGKFYLKIRGYRFAKIPEIETYPSNIVYEYKALELLGNLMPDNFPQVAYINPDEGVLIVTDAIPDGESFETLLRGQRVTQEILGTLGETLKKIHNSCKSISKSIRKNEDNEFFQEKLEHKLGYKNNPVLDDIVQEMTFYQPRQIIIGDPSPKNIGVNNNGSLFTFFDLEDVHRGNVVFDVGFLVGHIILHTHNNIQKAVAYVESFLRGYEDRHLETRLVKAIALGAIMYRLDSFVIPYSIDLSDEAKSSMLESMENILLIPDLDSLSWYELVRKILRKK
jgi:hypothetical protein